MKRKITITYWWKCSQFEKTPEQLEEALEERAEERIFEMLKEGYCSGELLDNINIDIRGIDTPKDGFVCRGWWDIEKK